MDKIDARVREAFSRGDTSVHVVIVCGSECERVADKLAAEGVGVERRAQEIGLLSATISASHVALLEADSAVEAVEPDEGVYAF